MRVFVLGATGMLGSAVAKYLYGCGYDLTLTSRDRSTNILFRFIESNKIKCRVIPFDPVINDVRCGFLGGVDCVVNCIGVIKPAIESTGVVNTLKINSVFPHELAEWCYGNDVRCINITTDCVYSGAKGGYVETDRHDVDDLYGRSKSIGEETRFCMTIRTSIVGEEIHNNASLIEWAKTQKGKQVNGFTNHEWNGITTTQYAAVVDRILRDDLYGVGLFHVFSPHSVSKYEMLKLFNQRFNLGLDIKPVRAEVPINRTLGTIKPLNAKLLVPEFEDQVVVM